ncbi:MAG TPA: PAS domain S-box protein [Candidatus Lokiarchaeia archaeon]|nr:PAS domain S-box protein [Candidatus Lokiarchaeia archaeon]
MLDSIDNPIFSVDPNYCYTSFNKAHAALMKALFNADIEIGGNMLDYHTVELDRLKAKENIDRALNGETVKVQEYSGEDTLSRRCFEITHNPIIDADGFVKGVVVNACDIADSKRMEEELHRSEEQYRVLFETMSEGFALDELIWDANGKAHDLRYLVVNPAFETQTGLKAAAIIGRTTLELFPDVEPDWFERYGQVVRTGEPMHFEEQFGPLNRWFEVNAFKVAENRFATVFKDITERKQAAEEREKLLTEVLEEREKLAAVVNSIQDEVWFADTSGEFTLANPAALREFTIGSGDEVDIEKLTTTLEVLRSDGTPRPVEEAPPLRALAGEVITKQEEIVRTPATGELRYREVNAAPVKDVEGNIIGSVSIVRDITDRIQATETLQHSEELFSTIFQAAPIAMSLASISDGKIQNVNQAWLNLNGFSQIEEVIGKTSVELGLIQDEETRERMLDEFRRSGSVQNAEIVAYTKTGESRNFLVNLHMVEISGRKMILSSNQDITKNKLLEENLLKSNEELESRVKLRTEELQAASAYARKLLDVNLDPLVTITLEGIINDVNDAAMKVTGCTRDELIGSDFSLYFTEPEKAREGYLRAFNEGFVKDYPLAIRDKSGNITDVLYNATTFTNESGEIQGVFADARDITQQKRDEQEFRQIYARNEILADISQKLAEEGFDYQAVLETIVHKTAEKIGDSCAVQLLSDDGYQLKVVAFHHPNPDAKALLRELFKSVTTIEDGLPGDIIKSRTPILIPIVPDDESVRITPAYKAYQEQFGVHSILGVPLIAHGKTIGLISLSRNELGNPYTDADLSAMQSIADLAALAIDNARSIEKIREQAILLDNAHEAISLRDLDNRFIYCNKGFELLYGWNCEEVTGKIAHEVLFKELSPQPLEALKIVKEGGEWSGEMHHVDRDGNEIIVDTRWTLMRDTEGNPESILAINSDITDKKKIEAQYLRAQRMESIGTLAGGIAHDMNNILTPIMLSVDLFKSKFDDEESQRLLEMLETNIKRGSDLTRQILSFARGVEGEHQPVQITRLITEIAKTMKETFPRSIEISTSIPEEPWNIVGDMTQLHQVLMNLCLNARDAMPYGGSLEIDVENMLIDDNYARMNIEAKAGPYVVISICDTGTGMIPAVMERIFEPFFTTKKQGEGTGLGLPTALGIVKSHGGFIHVYSEVGKGSTFKVYLPSGSMVEESAENQIRLEELRGQGELILIIDDEEMIRTITTATLEEHGYDAITASDGAEGIALYAQQKDKIAAVLLDMMMPIMDGYACTRALQKLNPTVKIIGISGLGQNGKHPEIVNKTTGFLVKPFTTEKLLSMVHDILSND